MNVFSDFVVIYTAIGCECNYCHLCRFLGKTAVSILSESRQLPPKSEFERTATDRFHITFHVYSRYLAATKDIHSTAPGCK